MSDVVIEEFHRESGRTTSTGALQVARFTCRVRGIVLVNVSLMRATDSTFFLISPMGSMVHGHTSGARIADHSLMLGILRIAVAEFIGINPKALPVPRKADARRRL